MYNYKAFKHPRNLVKFLNDNHYCSPLSIYEENGYITLVYIDTNYRRDDPVEV